MMTPFITKAFRPSYRTVISGKHSWHLAVLVATLGILPALGANATSPAVTDVAAELHVREVDDAYQTSRGIAICVMTAEGWFLWYMAHPHEHQAPTPRYCRLPAGAKDIAPMIQMGPTPYYAGGLRPAAFSGATSIVFNPGGPGAHCASLFSSYYVVTLPDGRKYGFYVIVRLAKPFTVSYISCEDRNLRATPFVVQFGELGVLNSVDAGNGTSILWFPSRRAAVPVILQVRGIPATAWASGNNVFLIPRSVLGPKLAAAGDDSSRRYQALLSVIRSIPR